MAVDSYVGWPSHVNKIILSQSTMSFGDGALKTDELEGGGKRSHLKGAFTPDKFNVVMEFEGSDMVKYIQGNTEITLNKTELQLFLEWYKYTHKYGEVPFEFPKIVYSPQTGVKCVDDTFGNTQVEYYKITSAVEGSKNGTQLQLKMTWESVYGGLIQIAEGTSTMSGITSATKNYMDITFNQISSTQPTKDLFTVYDGNTVKTITGFYFDNGYTARIYFDDLDKGKHTLSFAMSSYGGMTVSKGSYTYEVTV